MASQGLSFVGLLQLVSCTKSADTVSNESVSVQTSNDLTFAYTNEFANCKLRKIVHQHENPGYASTLVTGLFTYNSVGNPISLLYGNYTGVGYNHYFFYDKNNRLREWRQAYSINDPVEAVAHRYGYHSNNQVVTDTLMNSRGLSEDGKIIFYPRGVSTLEYDNLGRIVRETVKMNGVPTRYPTYTYDSRGNIAVKEWRSSSYDTKVSFFRTHPIFQLIHRNYSRNNPWNLSSQGRKYNSRALPLSVKPSNDAFFGASGDDRWDIES